MNEELFHKQISSSFDSLEVLEKIGQGGQKIVYKCVYEKDILVLKLIKINEQASLSRAKRELEIAESLKSQSFPKVLKHGGTLIGTDNYLYVIEEYIEGENLREYINKYEYEFNDVIKIGISLLKALEIVHSKQLVHRDIKPENIILKKNQVILLDFGIARDLTKESLTADIAFWGPMTIGYAAPEQIKNQKKIICNRTDIFSWGVLMYEMSTGVHPFRQVGLTHIEIIERTLKEEIPNLNTPNKTFNDLVSKSMNKVLHRRPIAVTKIIEKLESGIV